MPQQAAEIDFTSLIAAINAMTQTIGASGRTLVNILNDLNSGLIITPLVGAKYFHIAGAGTFGVDTVPGTLLSLNINTGATGGTGTFYDSASTSSLTDVVATVALDTARSTAFGPEGRGLVLNNGLVVVTTGTADITVGFA